MDLERTGESLSREAKALEPSVAKAIATITDGFDDAGGPGAGRSYVVACVDLFAAVILLRLLPRSG